MSNLLHKWREGLTSAYPSATSPYWRQLPLRRLTKLLLGAFFSAAGIGFVVDLLQLHHPPLGHGLFWPLLLGVMAVSVFAAKIRKLHLALFVWLFMVLLAALTFRVVGTSATFPIPNGIYQRVVFDSIGVWLGVGVGYRLLLSFVTTEGLDSVRMQTELSLAHGIQATLVPEVSWRNAGFEVYGKSIPSTEMGGDLLDVIESDGKTLVYVADVSGHGLAAGQLMGMLKTAIRVCLQFREDIVALLESADRVLPAVKEPDMYATVALLHFHGSGHAEYALAGHVPVLHYKCDSRETVRLSMAQFPIGLIPGGRYVSQHTSYSTGDLFLMLTDGVSETANEKDEEYGLERLEQLLSKHATESLPRIWELIIEGVRRHGLQQDDQTLLLIRVLH